MNIEAIMSTPVITCSPGEKLGHAAHLMWEHDIGVIPVVDDKGRVVGMLTDRDICMSTYTRGTAPQSIPVADAMAHDIFSCHPGDSLEAVEHLMQEKQLHRLPVVDGDHRIVGLISLNDIARHAMSTRKKNGLDHDVAVTLAAISAPRSQKPHHARGDRMGHLPYQLVP